MRIRNQAVLGSKTGLRKRNFNDRLTCWTGALFQTHRHTWWSNYLRDTGVSCAVSQYVPSREHGAVHTRVGHAPDPSVDWIGSGSSGNYGLDWIGWDGCYSVL